jgi:hypothetical protein
LTPDDTAYAVAEPINDLASLFMLDPMTRQRGAELGFRDADFAIVGRGGVLGRVAPDVVAAALVFFHPDTVRRAWLAGLQVMDPRDVSAVFGACAHTWARRLPDSLDVARLATLAGAVVAGAGAAGAPLFAGWRAMPEPEDPGALALHRLYVLRELRAAVQGTSVLAAGLTPADAVRASDPDRAAVYGWPVDLADPGPTILRWELARNATAHLLAPAFAVLDETQRTDLVDLVTEALAAAQGSVPAPAS